VYIHIYIYTHKYVYRSRYVYIHVDVETYMYAGGVCPLGGKIFGLCCVAKPSVYEELTYNILREETWVGVGVRYPGCRYSIFMD